MSYDRKSPMTEAEKRPAELEDTVVTARNLSKGYPTTVRPGGRLLELMTGRKRPRTGLSMALENVSFELKRGDRLGIVGENGSGKSTLLKILCNVLQPTAGYARINGRISALLELGAGFNPELTGRDNIRQFCRLHGLSAIEAEESIEGIIHFSELGNRVDKLLRTYSSGEAVRLGFACAVYVKPDVLIVDEALSVGDAYFQIKCMNKIQAMLDEGVTFIYVTHAADGVRALCNKALWLENGRIRLIGNARDIGQAYEADMFRRVAAAGLSREVEARESLPADDARPTELSPKPSDVGVDRLRAAEFSDRVAEFRTGTNEIRIEDVMLVGMDGELISKVPFEADFHFRIFFVYEREIAEPVDIGIGLADSRGVEILHHSLASEGLDARSIGVGSRGVVNIHSKNFLCPGEFSLNVGANTLAEVPGERSRKRADKILDYCIGACRVVIERPACGDEVNLWGVVRSDFRATISPI